MYEVSVFVPKIFLCGDKAKFFAMIEQRPFELVGNVQFWGETAGQKLNFINDGKFALNDKIHNHEELEEIFKAVDYVIFLNAAELKIVCFALQKFNLSNAKLITANYFKHLPSNGLFDVNADLLLLKFLRKSPFKTVLDVDAYFGRSSIFSCGDNDVTKIDCISQHELPPIKENIYRHVYKNLAECRLKHYDAVLFNSISSSDFIVNFSRLEHISDVIITYARKDSDVYKYIVGNKKFFSQISALETSSGVWLFCYRYTPQKNFKVYVVTHKKMPDELVENLPDNYKIIHAGKTLSPDLGYIGDNTEENISYLNPYINELTALYWIWKNTSHTIIGISHYRRFFTESHNVQFSYEKILTSDAAEKILERYDVIATIFHGLLTQIEEIGTSYPQNALALAQSIIEENMENVQPSYVNAFHFVMNSTSFYRYNIFITRKNIFDSYCKWLFSFFLDAVKDIQKKISLPQSKMRLSGFFGERLLTVWLMKNHLRIKELEVMQVPNL